jgi:hypothetical protein
MKTLAIMLFLIALAASQPASWLQAVWMTARAVLRI